MNLRQTLARLLTCAVALCGPAWGQWNYPPGSSLAVPTGGSVDLFCIPLNMEGTLSLEGALHVDSDAAFGATAAVTGSGGTMTVGGDLISAGTVNLSSSTVILTDGCTGGTTQLSGSFVFQNLTLSSSTGHTFVIPEGSHLTVLGVLTLQGTPGANVQLQSSGAGTAFITLGPGATVVSHNATVPPSVRIGPAPAAAAHAIPTLGPLGLVALSLLLAALAWRQRGLAPAPARPSTPCSASDL